MHSGLIWFSSLWSLHQPVGMWVLHTMSVCIHTQTNISQSYCVTIQSHWGILLFPSLWSSDQPFRIIGIHAKCVYIYAKHTLILVGVLCDYRIALWTTFFLFSTINYLLSSGIRVLQIGGNHIVTVVAAGYWLSKVQMRYAQLLYHLICKWSIWCALIMYVLCFISGNNKCIVMEQRCNQAPHCKDRSDELDCNIGVVEGNYKSLISISTYQWTMSMST
jgi:hypothetical protein